MQLINLEQGTEKWLDFRRCRITATDFAVLASNKGLSNKLFSKKLDSLIADKVSGKKIPENKYFALGRELEPIILSKVNFLDIISSEIATLDSNNRIMASFDARDTLLECIVEIKTTSKPMDKIDKLIDFYKFQLAHQCYVAGYKFGYLIFGFCENFELKQIKQVEIIAEDVIKYDEWFKLCEEFLVLLDMEGTK